LYADEGSYSTTTKYVVWSVADNAYVGVDESSKPTLTGSTPTELDNTAKLPHAGEYTITVKCVSKTSDDTVRAEGSVEKTLTVAQAKIAVDKDTVKNVLDAAVPTLTYDGSEQTFAFDTKKATTQNTWASMFGDGATGLQKLVEVDYAESTGDKTKIEANVDSDNDGNVEKYTINVKFKFTTDALTAGENLNYYLDYGEADQSGNIPDSVAIDWTIGKATNEGFAAEDEYSAGTTKYSDYTNVIVLNSTGESKTISAADLLTVLPSDTGLYKNAKLVVVDTATSTGANKVKYKATTEGVTITASEGAAETGSTPADFMVKLESDNCADIEVWLHVKVVEKTEEEIEIIEPTIVRTYTGETFDWDNEDVNAQVIGKTSTNGKFSYKYSPKPGSSTASLKDGLPFTAGDYLVTVTYADDKYVSKEAVSFTLTINKADLTIASVTTGSKVYDGTTTASNIITGLTFADLKACDQEVADGLSVGQGWSWTGTPVFASANVGTDIAVTGIEIYLINSTLDNNYTLTNGATVEIKASITQKDVTDDLVVEIPNHKGEALTYLGNDTVGLGETVKFGTAENYTALEKGTDYELVFSQENGYGYVTITPVATSNYTFTYDAEPSMFYIVAATLDGSALSATYEWTVGTEINTTGVVVSLNDATIEGEVTLDDAAKETIGNMVAGDSTTVTATFAPSGDVYTEAVTFTLNVNAVAAPAAEKTALDPAAVDVSGLTLTYTKGTTVNATSIGNSVTLSAGGTVTGAFSVTPEQQATIEALEVGTTTASVTFTPAESDEHYNNTPVTLTVSVVVLEEGTELSALNKDDVAALSIHYTQGTEPSLAELGTSVTLKDGTVVNGAFTALDENQINEIKALTENGTVTVTFTPASENYTTDSVVLDVTVIFQAQATDETETPEEVPKAAVVDAKNVTVVLSAYTFKVKSSYAKPTVTVYTADGTTLAKKNYEVVYDKDATVGTKTLKVILDEDCGYTFTDGSMELDVNYNVVDKKSGVTITTGSKKKTITYGTELTLKDLKVTLKEGSSKLTAGEDYELNWNYGDLVNEETGLLDAGVYNISVWATYGDDEIVYAQVLVTVKTKTVAPKAAKLDWVYLKDVENLDPWALEDEITTYVAENTRGLNEDDFIVEVDEKSVTDAQGAQKAGTKKISYRITLTNENLTFSGGKDYKDVKVSLKIKNNK
jgi:hypothetical protein